MKNLNKLFVLVAITTIGGLYSNFSSSSEIEETVLGMNVSGNKEVPKLLYIIPWKDDADNATPPEVYRLMDEVYSTVDPDVFEKEVLFFDQLTETSLTQSNNTDNDQ